MTGPNSYIIKNHYSLAKYASLTAVDESKIHLQRWSRIPSCYTDFQTNTSNILGRSSWNLRFVKYKFWRQTEAEKKFTEVAAEGSSFQSVLIAALERRSYPSTCNTLHYTQFCLKKLTFLFILSKTQIKLFCKNRWIQSISNFPSTSLVCCA